MTQVPARLVFWLVVILVGIGFWAGALHWNREAYKCFEGKRFYGDWVTVLAISKFEVRVKAYGCPEKDRYDPQKFRPTWEYSPTPEAKK